MIKDREQNYDFRLAWLQYVVYGSIILYFGRDIFIPLSFAVLISFVIYPSCKWLEKMGFKRMNAILINVSLLLIVLLGMMALLISQVISFLQEWSLVETKLMESLKRISEFMSESYGLSNEQQSKWLTQLFNQSGSGAIMVLRQMISSTAFSSVLMMLIPVYSVLILYYRELWVKVLLRLFQSERKESLYNILSLTITAYHNFVKGMGLVYLIVGILNSVGLLLLGVPHAILFGFIAALLTFIPYVGIIIGSLLPITMAWIAYDSIWYPVGVIAIFAFVQYLEANIIFPMAVSNRLNVNTLVMLISIFAGGLLWGMAGMILFVPLVGILKLIADHSPKLKTLSIFLGTDPAA